ncbi:LPXTG cell wall anchor domain-containing protein [Salininema proteolyticum]|uniref:LPXTG cell wall anchor domain-containing protein n=1 Tax=Salininema proteolyticum TaxID=1607685 RepID=A0ABV8U2W4_9ACTN
MSLRNSTLIRSGAACGAALLALSTAAPAFAQDSGEVDNDLPERVLEFSDLEGALQETSDPAFFGDGQEVSVSDYFLGEDHGFEFELDAEGIVSLEAGAAADCGVEGAMISCTGIVDGPDFLLNAGEDAEPGATVGYTFSVEADGEEVAVQTGTITVESKDGEELPDPELPDPEEGEDGEEDDELNRPYLFGYLDHELTNANPGETVTAGPQVRVYEENTSFDDRAGTIVHFSNSIDLDEYVLGENYWDEALTGNVEVAADYDNCRTTDYGAACVITDFDPEVGKTYAPSESTPVQYNVLNAVGDNEIAAYVAYDFSESDLEGLTEYVDLEGGNQFQLTEVAEDEQISDDYFFTSEGWIYFSGDVKDIAEKLPTTGNDQTWIIVSASAALIVGVGAVWMARRRKVAAEH